MADIIMPTPTNSHIQQDSEISTTLQCTRCGDSSDDLAMQATCARCGGPLSYAFTGAFGGGLSRSDQWRYFDLLPLKHTTSIVSLGEGGSEVIDLPELSSCIGGARLFLKLDCVKNPTGTFKDREASVVISRCRELGLNGLVFYSTGNTGRAYTHYAAHVGLTTYCFLPLDTHYKQTASFLKRKNNFLILVDDDYRQIAGYAKAFAAANQLTVIAPMHDRTESYATLAYEQHAQLPHCDWFAQTIASGMGPIGFLRGHRHLVNLGLESTTDIPRIACVQSEETNVMSRVYNAGRDVMTAEDLPAPREALFEPTLNSTNPVTNFPSLRECLRESNGVITDVAPARAEAAASRLVAALESRRIYLQFDIEKSLLIGFAGLIRLADEGRIHAGERIMLLATGRGGVATREVVPADAIIRVAVDDPVDVKARLHSR